MSWYSEWNKWSSWYSDHRDLNDNTWWNSWTQASERYRGIDPEQSRLLILMCVFAVVMVVVITVAAKRKCKKLEREHSAARLQRPRPSSRSYGIPPFSDEAHRTIIMTTNINRVTISIPETQRMSPSLTAHRDTDETSSPLSEAYDGELSGDNISDCDPPIYNDALDTSIYPKSHQQYMYKDDDPLHDLGGSCDLPSYSEATLGYTQVPIISDPQEGDLTEPPSYTPEELDAIRD